MGAQKNDYSKWSEEELRRAESEADRFLNDNEEQIREIWRRNSLCWIAW